MIKTLYRSLASAKLTLFLFLVLAVTSVFGTIVPQGIPVERYMEMYGPVPACLIRFFHIFDLYHSWWFMGLLLLLAANIAACTARQTPRLFRYFMSRNKNGDDSVFQIAPIRKTYRSSSPVDVVRQQSETLLRSLAGKPNLANIEGKTYFYAERGRYARLGMAAIHVSILFILTGALIGSIWGFGGQMRIAEGTSSKIVELFGGGTRTLPFAVACDDFSVSFYDNGMPREYRSDVTVLDGEKKVLSAAIRVNEPLKYGGLKFCQATYGIAEASHFKVTATHAVTGEKTPLTLGLMRKVSLPDGTTSFAAARFSPDFRGRGPAVLGVLLKPGEPHDIFWLFYNDRQQAQEPHGGYTFEFQDFAARFYTGLQVGNDPGGPLVWSGFILILTGFVISLFGVHRRVWLRIAPVTQGSEILIAVDAGKRKGDFEKRLDEECRKIFTL